MEVNQVVEVVHAPFTTYQVRHLNEYQTCGLFHEYTCPNGCNYTSGFSAHNAIRAIKLPLPLRATFDGWVCGQCGYTQDWAYRWMADKYWLKAQLDLMAMKAGLYQHSNA
jgi:hypothetical protein